MSHSPYWLFGAAFALVWISSAVSAEDLATLDLRLQLANLDRSVPTAPPTSVSAAVELRNLHDDEVIRTRVAVPGTARIAVHPEVAMELRVKAKGFWSPPQILHVSEPTLVARIDLRPTATLSALVTVPQGHSLPEKLEVLFESAPDAPDSLDGEYSQTCPLSGEELMKRELRCEIPAGNLDLHFRAAGFITIHRWDIDLRPSLEQALGPLTLRPGASVVGRVAAAGEDFDPQGVEVELLPNRAGLALGDARRPGILGHRVRANSRGFYELTDIPPGSYTLLARHPGFAPARLKPVVVQEGVEVELRTLELERPRSLEVHLSPPTDPFGNPWRVKLLQPGGLPNHWADAGDETPDEEGIVRISDLISSTHRLQILDRRGNRWYEETIELHEPITHLEVELPFERLEARVTLDGEPLPALVIFRGIEDGSAVSRESDEEGKVYVFLPQREEPWTVDVESEDSKIRAQVEGIRVERKSGEPWAKAEIEVPNTRVFGAVVDDQGSPLPGALVDIRGPGQGAFEQVQARGSNAEFELGGYPGGPWNLEAQYQEAVDAPSFSAPLTEIFVVENVPAGPIRLVAHREQILRGRVVSPEGIGIPGTMVVAGLEQPQRLTRSVQHRATGLDGQFTLRLPARVPAVQLHVFPPGFIAHQVRVELPRADPLVLQAETVGGTLIVQWADEERNGATSRESLRSRVALFGEFLFYNPALDLWAGMHELADERRLMVPNLESGTYTACLGGVEAAFDTGRLPVGFGERCVSGDLSPFGELILEVPAPESNRSGSPPEDTSSAAPQSS